MKKEVIIIYIVVALIAMFFITKILKRFGILKSESKIAKEKAIKELDAMEYFNPMYSKDKTFKPMSPSELKGMAKVLKKAMRGFGTNEEELYTVFKNLYNKVNISQLSEVYYERYKKNLESKIKNELNKKEKVKLVTIIRSLPNY
jgi:hypothetical protein